MMEPQDVIGIATAITKLYLAAYADDLERATAHYLVEIKRIKAKYLEDVSTPNPFAMLLKAYERNPEWLGNTTTNPETNSS